MMNIVQLKRRIHYQDFVRGLNARRALLIFLEKVVHVKTCLRCGTFMWRVGAARSISCVEGCVVEVHVCGLCAQTAPVASVEHSGDGRCAA